MEDSIKTLNDGEALFDGLRVAAVISTLGPKRYAEFLHLLDQRQHEIRTVSADLPEAAPKLRKLVHRFHGAATSVGLRAAGEAGEVLEQALRAGETAIGPQLEVLGAAQAAGIDRILEAYPVVNAHYFVSRTSR